jgi:glycosidase
MNNGNREPLGRHPLLYQVNTRVFLQERGAALGRRATFDDIPDSWLDEVAGQGFAWLWFLGVWQTGAAARQVSRSNAKLRAAFTAELPDVRDDDVVGSPFAVVAWEVHQDFGGDAALARIRERLARRGVKLLLDFVPNHVAPDHPWVRSHPEYFVAGTQEDLRREPHNYVRVQTGRGPAILAYGRDPYFDGWPDTLQLNYRHAGLREAQVAELRRISERCDGVRCDMAMLVQPAVFQRTWGDRARPLDGSPPRDTPFWPEAIAAVRRRRPEFLFVAEVYWDLEWELQQAGFDYTYDKRLYDRLHARDATAVRDHLRATPEFQRRSLRFLENHDEPRAAAAFDEPVYRAAAAIAFFVPGMRFFHEGELDGRRVHVSMHLGRRPAERVEPRIRAFHDRLLAALRRPEVHDGRWQLWDCRPAWDGNPTHAQFIVMSWDQDERRLVVVSNYGPSQGQCYVTLALPGLAGKRFTLVDLLGDTRYDRDGDALATQGLYLDVPAWGHHVFEMAPR